MINLPKIEDPRGNLTFIEHGPKGACPFEIGKVSWIYDVAAGGTCCRDASSADELVVAMSGSFDAAGLELRRSNIARRVTTGEECLLADFSTNSVAMIIAAGKEECHQARPIVPHNESSVDDCHIMYLPRRRAHGSSMTQVDNADPRTPFAVRRVFYLYDVPADAERGGHSHHRAQELIVALSGSFDVVLDDGKNPPRRFSLNRPYQALYITTGIWRTLDNFSGGAVCMVLTSERYSEDDYVREYDQFKELTK